MLRSDPVVSRVLNASRQLEDILKRNYPKPAFKPVALQVVYALSVYRLTTGGLDVQTGLTAEALKDDLCLYLPMPEQDADFLLGVVNQVLRDTMTTVSGQFIVHNEANNQYYIDVNKVVDYDERIRQKAAIVAQGELNRYFYGIVYQCLDWSQKQYVANFQIYQYDLMWTSHNMFREGYLFLGLPDERSTAQPERDFYLHFMPPYDGAGKAHDLEDEAYFYFKPTYDFTSDLRFYAAAKSLEEISEGKERDAYAQKAQRTCTKLVRALGKGKNTLFDVAYCGTRRQMIEVLKGSYDRDATFKDTIDKAASLCLDGYFTKKYPRFSVMQVRITRANMAESLRAGYDQVAGRNSQLGQKMLRSFDLLDANGKMKAEGSPYAKYYIGLLSKLPPQGVINFGDLFEEVPGRGTLDKQFGYPSAFAVIILLALVYLGRAVIKTDDALISTSNLGDVPKTNAYQLQHFKYLSKPSDLPLAELRHLFDVLDLNPSLLNNESTREKAVEDLVNMAKELSQSAAAAERKLSQGFSLWGEPLVNAQESKALRDACSAVKDEFSNYGAKFNTPAKLNNFRHSDAEIDAIAEQIDRARLVGEYVAFQSSCAQIVTYVESIEYREVDDQLKDEIDEAKKVFRQERDDIFDGDATGDEAAQAVLETLQKVKDDYIDLYFKEHKKRRLGAKEAQRKQKLLEGPVMATLRKLSKLDVLPRANFYTIDHELAALKVCYELTSTELEANPICPHCHMGLDDGSPNVAGRLDQIEGQMDQLLKDWTETLLNTIDDPLVLAQKQFLSQKEQGLVDGFLQSKILPTRVDDSFVEAIEKLQQGFEAIYVDGKELVAELAKLGPSTAEDFKKKFNSYIEGKTRGKNRENLRVIVRSE